MGVCWRWLQPRLVFLLLLCTMSAILGRHATHRQGGSLSPRVVPSAHQPLVTVTGTIQSQPELHQGRPRYLCVLTPHQRVLLTVPPTAPALWPGDRVTLTGRVFRPGPAINPGGFDYQAFLTNQRIEALLTVDDAATIHITGRASLLAPWTLAAKLRRVFARVFREHLPPVAAAILGGFMIGERSELPSAVEQAFRDAGVFHLLVVSGSNVVLVMGLVVGFWRLCSFSRRFSLIASLPVIWFYALMSGGDPPVCRATVMATVGVLAYLLRREAAPTHCLALAALVVLLWEPLALFDASFQLSFMATLGIVWAVPHWSQRFTGSHLINTSHPHPLPLPSRERVSGGRVRGIYEMSFSRALTRWVWPLLITSLSAQLAVAPVVVWYFHRLSLIGLVANLVIPLLAEGVVLAGVGLLGLAWLPVPLHPPGRSLVNAVSWMTAQLVDVLVRCVEAFARVPGAAITVAPPSWWDIACFYGLGIACVLGFTSRRWRWAGGGLLLVWLTGWAAAQWSPQTLYKIGDRLQFYRKSVPIPSKVCPPSMKVWILAVGLGDAVVIQFPAGERWLIDGGGAVGSPDRVGERILLPALWALDIRRLDTMILTHPRITHYGAQRTIAQHMRVGRWVAGPTDGAGADYEELLRLLWRRGIPVHTIRTDETWQVGSVRVETVGYPHSTTASPLPLSVRPTSFPSPLLLKIQYGNCSLLFTSDATTLIQRILVPLARSSTVVLVPHHGTVALDPAFAEALHGVTAVVSSDQPSPRAVYQVSGAKDVFITHRDGAILIETDGQTTQVRPYIPQHAEE